jgi:hypothetical protein
MKTLRLLFETGDVDMFSRNKKKQEKPEQHHDRVMASLIAAPRKPAA